MSTHKMCYHGAVRKISIVLVKKKVPYLELCISARYQWVNILTDSCQRQARNILVRVSGTSSKSFPKCLG